MPKTAISAADRGTARSAWPEKLETWMKKTKKGKDEEKSNITHEQQLNKFWNFLHIHFHCNCSFISITLFLCRNHTNSSGTKCAFLSMKKNMKLHLVVKWIWLPHFSLQTETFYLQIDYCYYCYYHTVWLKYQLRFYSKCQVPILWIIAKNMIFAYFYCDFSRKCESNFLRFNAQTPSEREICATCLNDFDRTYESRTTEFPIYSNWDFTLCSSEMTHDPTSQSVSPPTKHTLSLPNIRFKSIRWYVLHRSIRLYVYAAVVSCVLYSFSPLLLLHVMFRFASNSINFVTLQLRRESLSTKKSRLSLKWETKTNSTGQYPSFNLIIINLHHQHGRNENENKKWIIEL